MGVPRILPYGDRAVLVELDDPAEVTAFAAAVTRAGRAGGLEVVDVVPAAATVLVTFDHRRTDRRAVATVLAALAPDEAAPATDDHGPVVVLMVDYDGEDLELVAARTGLSVAEVIELHQRPLYRSAFCGFAPGFAYLAGGDPRLAVARLDTPRPRVPAGSVAIAAGWTGVYPRAMPGGWLLLGRTDAALWDLDRPAPALLPPGTRVRFRERVA